MVKAESLRNKVRNNQCRNCQLFGHKQSKCTATPKCLKCASNHHTSSCRKTRETPAKCDKCSGVHPDNYSKCQANPKYIKEQRTIRTRAVIAEASYANITKQSKTPTQSPLQTHTSTETKQNSPTAPYLNQAVLSIQKFAQQMSLLSSQLNQ